MDWSQPADSGLDWGLDWVGPLLSIVQIPGGRTLYLRVKTQPSPLRGYLSFNLIKVSFLIELVSFLIRHFIGLPSGFLT